MTNLEIKKMIQRHEGYRPFVYYDSLGYPTGGYGHCFLPESPISHSVAMLLFEEDFERACKDYDRLQLDLDPVRRGIIIDMLFNLGLTKFWSFKNMIKAIRVKNYNLAAQEMIDSKWARQTKSRAYHLAEMMRTGKA
jgi:lysozyme